MQPSLNDEQWFLEGYAYIHKGLADELLEHVLQFTPNSLGLEVSIFAF